MERRGIDNKIKTDVFCAQEEEELLGGDQEEIAEEEQTGHTKAGRTGTTSGTQMAKFL